MQAQRRRLGALSRGAPSGIPPPPDADPPAAAGAEDTPNIEPKEPTEPKDPKAERKSRIPRRIPKRDSKTAAEAGEGAGDDIDAPGFGDRDPSTAKVRLEIV